MASPDPVLLDIALPAAPAASTLPLLLGGLLGLVAVLAALLWHGRLSRRGRARHRLRRLQHQAGDCPERFAWQLAALLREGLALPRLTATTPLPARLAPQARRWQIFIGQLDQARYAGRTPNPAERQRLLAEARHWLRAWP